MVIKLIRYDFARGISANKGRIVISFILIISLIIIAHMQANDLGEHITLIDYLLYFSKGMEPYDPEQGVSFFLPIEWMTTTVVLIYLVGFYPCIDYSESASKVVVRSSRVLWWLSKCVWVVVCVMVFYAVVFLLTVGMSFISHGLEISSPNYDFIFYGDAISGYNDIALFQIVIELLVSIFCSMAIILFMVFLTFCVKPYLSFIITMTYIILSCYLNNLFFIADYAMIARSRIVDSSALPGEFKILICILCSITIVISGSIMFTKKEFYDN